MLIAKSAWSVSGMCVPHKSPLEISCTPIECVWCDPGGGRSEKVPVDFDENR